MEEEKEKIVYENKKVFNRLRNYYEQFMNRGPKELKTTIWEIDEITEDEMEIAINRGGLRALGLDKIPIEAC